MSSVISCLFFAFLAEGLWPKRKVGSSGMDMVGRGSLVVAVAKAEVIRLVDLSIKPDELAIFVAPLFELKLSPAELRGRFLLCVFFG